MKEDHKALKKEPIKAQYMRLSDYADMVRNENHGYDERNETSIRVKLFNL